MRSVGRGARISRTLASREDADAQSSDELSPNKPAPRTGRRMSLHERELLHGSSQEVETDDELSPRKSAQTAARRATVRMSKDGQAQQADSMVDHSPIEKTLPKVLNKQSLFVGVTTSSDGIEENSTSPRPKSRRDPLSSKSPNSTSVTSNAHKRRAEPPSDSSQPKKRPKRSTGATVPVTVHRLSKPPTLTNDTDHSPAPRIPTLNAIDVLAQVTSEISARLSASLSSQSQRQPSSDVRTRAVLRRKRQTVQAFSAHLSDALFGLAEALDAGAALQSRLRAARKEKVALREELLGVRRRRQEVLVKMDEVRAEHARVQKEEGQRDSLNEGVCGIEVAVQRGRERARALGCEEEGPVEGIEEVVQGLLGAGVSGKGQGRGMLERVRAFNAFLERAAGVLEGRA